MPFTISFSISTMAFPTFVVLLCQVAVFLSLCAVGEGRYSIFRRFKEAQDTKQGSPFEEQWFTQKLDHFNGADTRVWKQAGLHVGLYGRLFDLTVWSNLVQLDKCVIMHASVTKDKAFLAHFTATPLMCLFFLLSECLSLCCSLSEVLYKWSLLQAWWAGVSDDRGRGPSKSSMDGGWHLAHLRWETGSTLLDAGASLLWKESPYSVCLSLSLCSVYERNLCLCGHPSWQLSIQPSASPCAEGNTHVCIASGSAGLTKLWKHLLTWMHSWYSCSQV